MKIESKYKIEKAASTDTARYVLQSVYVHENRMIATDGRMLASVPCEHAPEENGKIVPAAVLGALRKSQKALARNTSFLTAELNGSIKAIGDNGEKLEWNYVEGNYPNYKQVIPPKEEEATISISFDAELLSKLAEALGATNGKQSIVTLKIKDALSAFIVKANNNSEAFGVLMPVRAV